jgi:cyclopropane fatty-acyl-phospholipid synthase-like methyltransferase
MSTTYHSAKILLENNSQEIFSSSDIKSNKIMSRKINSEGNIISEIKEIDFLQSHFDNIISFEIINKNNIKNCFELYFSLLKKNGTLILLIPNKEKMILKNKNNFDKDEFINKISSKFTISEIYSQRFLEKENRKIENKLGMIREKGAKIIKKMDKNEKLYRRIFQTNMKKINSLKQNIEKIPDDDFIPKKFNKNKQPLFLLFICKKN